MATTPCEALIKEFSTRTVVPVELDDVVAALVKAGVKDKIWYFLQADLDPSILEGVLSEWEYPEDEKTVRAAHIDCAKSITPQRKRLVVCKELLHLLDPDIMRVATEEDFKKLTDSIGLPPEDQKPAKVGHQTINDRIGIYKAVAVLFPWAAREAFRPHFPEKLNHEDIAVIVDIPPRYAALVMSPLWDELHPLLLGEAPKKAPNNGKTI